MKTVEIAVCDDEQVHIDRFVKYIDVYSEESEININIKFYIRFLIIRMNTILSNILKYRKTLILPRIYHDWMSLDMTLKITPSS